MKTIAVLTDFTDRAIHATRFAMHIAKKMNADILLFNVSAVLARPELVLASEEERLDNADTVLADFALKMEIDIRNRSFPGSRLPEVKFNCDGPDIVDVITAIAEDEDILMIVLPSPENVELATYLQSDAFNRIVDWAAVPVLVVPENTPIRNFEKIAFATTLHEDDIISIGELGNLMQNFGAELMVAHLNTNPADKQMKHSEHLLNRSLYDKLCCGGVYFRSIPDTTREKNWDWLKANKRTDLLAVVQQSREQMAHFFNRGRNAYATYHINSPVIILPKRP